MKHKNPSLRQSAKKHKEDYLLVVLIQLKSDNKKQVHHNNPPDSIPAIEHNSSIPFKPTTIASPHLYKTSKKKFVGHVPKPSISEVTTLKPQRVGGVDYIYIRTKNGAIRRINANQSDLAEIVLKHN